MWGWELDDSMYETNSRASSEMTIDFRTSNERDAAKYDRDLLSLNTEYRVFTSEPHLLYRDAHWHWHKPTLYHLKL